MSPVERPEGLPEGALEATSPSVGPSVPRPRYVRRLTQVTPPAAAGEPVAGPRAPGLGIKGSHVLQTRNYTNERLGAGTFERLVAHEGPVWTLPLLPSSWYELAPLVAAIRQVANRTGGTVQEVTRDIARRNGLLDLKTLYRVFLTNAAPERVLGFTPQLWSTYVKFGGARALRNEPGRYLGECSGVPSPYLDWACGMWLGFVPAVVEVTGGREVRARIVKRAPDGDEATCVIQCEVDYAA